jgi:acetyl esterase/lipase
MPGSWAGIPAMFGGWLTSELAPHLIALTVADTALHLTPDRRNRHALALAAGSLAGLSAMVVQSDGAKGHVDRALRDALADEYLDQLTATYTDLDLSTPIGQLAMPFRMRNDDVEVIKDVAYADTGRRGLLDVYRQRGTDLKNAPVLLQVHGGGWTIGNKDQQGIPLMLHMAARGWVCVAINYRLSPRAKFPDHIIDVKRAIAWIRSHGREYGAGSAYIAITGGSAGGHLAALAALTPNDPEYQPGFEDADTTLQAAAPHYGIYDLAGSSGTKQAQLMRDRFVGPYVLFKDPRTQIEEFERASPLLRVNADAPPFFVIHGMHDSLVGVDQAREFVNRLRELSAQPVAYAELPGTQHAFDVFPSIRSAHVVRGVDRFLRWNFAQTVDAATDASH